VNHYEIWFKHSRLWEGYKHLISVYRHSLEEVEQTAKDARCYYEGVTEYKIIPIGGNKDGSNIL
jgi:archaellum component FlaC